MSTVTVNGNTYSSAGEAARDMRNGGHRTWLLPMLADAVLDLAAKVASAVAAPGTSATSSSSLTIGTGAQSLTIQTGKSIVEGMRVICARTSAPENFMFGRVTSYNSGTGAFAFTSEYAEGSGTFTDWTISLTGLRGLSPEIERIPRSSDTQITATNKQDWISATSAFTQSFDTPANLGDKWFCFYSNDGTGVITIPSSDGVTNWKMYPGEMRLFHSDGSTLRSIVLRPFAVTFTSTDTFVMPPGYATIGVDAIGPGGSGGSGRRGAAGSARTGGSSGGGGARVIRLLGGIAAGTSITATIGAAGAVGAAVTGDSTNGAAAAAGGSTTFGAYATAYAGGPGGGGATTANNFGGSGGGSGGAGVAGGASAADGGKPSATTFGGSTARNNVGGGGGGSDTTAGCAEWGGGGGGLADDTTTNTDGGSSVFGPGAGGAGAGRSSADVTNRASTGGVSGSYTPGGGPTPPAVGSSSNGTAGSNGTNGLCGGGGTGGGFGASSAAGTGGAGGEPGGGGGGGGASVNGQNSGAGGLGGRGEIRVWGVQ